jgi:bifunctional enzyme CysN/CysC
MPDFMLRSNPEELIGGERLRSLERLGSSEASHARGPAKVVWITGYSASGKTTVGRRVELMLRERETSAVFLDGDDLRSILSHKWGYTREDRVGLARVYFRLCSLLASQGIMVVISAVAMYDEVRDWLATHVPGVVEVYLDVPERERRERDQATHKGIYDQLESPQSMYDEPKAPDLVVRNYGEVSPVGAARRIVEFLDVRHFSQQTDHGRREHWRRFYAQDEAPKNPSSFARLVAAHVSSPGRVLEVGCGNGRDASFLASLGFEVVAIDISEEAIEACLADFGADGLSFLAADVDHLPAEERLFDIVYSRFTLHAMTSLEEDRFVAESAARLRPGGQLFVECRSIKDPLAGKGEVISRTERIHGHYRRFIVADELRAKLEAKRFRIESLQEKQGVAKLGDDDPVVIRLSATLEA